MLTIETLRQAYDKGLFPMADGPDKAAEIGWYLPDPRAVFLFPAFHVSRRLARVIRKRPFEIRWNDDFRAVMQECAAQRKKDESWISPELVTAYTAWHEAGEAFCLSVFQEGVRVGGIYGVQRGAIFMAESMFSRVSNASSVALVVLMAGLQCSGIKLVDVQFENPHTEQFHPALMTNDMYQEILEVLKDRPVILNADYFSFETAISFVQSLTQTS